MKTNTPPTVSARSRHFFAGQRGAVFIAAIVLAASGFALWKYLSISSPAWLVRVRVHGFLKKESHTSDFTVSFPFPSKAEMAKPPARPVSDGGEGRSPSGKDFETLRGEYFPLKDSALALERQLIRNGAELRETTARLDSLVLQLAAAETTNASKLESRVASLRERVATLQKAESSSRSELQAKQATLAPIVSELFEFQRRWLADSEADGSLSAKNLAEARVRFTTEIREKFDQAASYSEIYGLIGKEIWVVDHLRGSANPAHRRAGVSLALTASHHALGDAQNGWLAARICEGYVLPNLELAAEGNSRLSAEDLLTECADIFQQNNEWKNVFRLYEAYLARAASPARADWARARLSMACEQAGELERALYFLRQIQNTNDYRGELRRLPWLAQQVKLN